MSRKNIAGFFLDGWYVFDNFAPFQIEWRGKLYPTSEHAYQAAHFIDTKPELAEEIRHCLSPRLASDFANYNSQYDDPEWGKKKSLSWKKYSELSSINMNMCKKNYAKVASW